MSVLGAQQIAGIDIGGIPNSVANTGATRLLDNPFTIREFVNLGVNGFLERERIRAGQPLNGGIGQGNNISDFPRITTGVNSDGSTIPVGRPSNQLVSGVDNRALLIGVGLLAVTVAAIVAVN